MRKRDRTDIEVLVDICGMISEFHIPGKNHRYTVVSGPITYVHKGSGYERELFCVDHEPGISFFETRWEAFASYGAVAAAKFWRDVEGDFWRNMKHGVVYPITKRHIPLMLKMIKSSSGFYTKNGSSIAGPMSRLEPLAGEPTWHWYTSTVKKKRGKVYSLSDAFKTIGYRMESEVIKRLIEKN